MNSVTTSPLMSLTTEPQPQAVAKARELREAFSSFVGEAFYGQMLKSMRSTVGKPAYFHGGQAEETFRSQLDQQLAQELAAETGDRFAGPMFEQQFPEQARLLTQAENTSTSPLAQLDTLRRR
jgi:Rod binding domain-containing protein